MTNILHKKVEVEHSSFEKFIFVCFTESPLEMMKNEKFLRYFCFFHDFFGYVENRLDKKAKVNFKIYVVLDWPTNNFNTYIVSYLKKPM